MAIRSKIPLGEILPGNDYVLPGELLRNILERLEKLENIRGGGATMVKDTGYGFLVWSQGGKGGTLPRLMKITNENSSSNNDIRYAQAQAFDINVGTSGPLIGVCCNVAHAIGELIWVEQTTGTLIYDENGSDPTARVYYQEQGYLGTPFLVKLTSNGGSGAIGDPWQYSMTAGTTGVASIGGTLGVEYWQPIIAKVPSAATFGLAIFTPQLSLPSLSTVSVKLIAPFETVGTTSECPTP